MLHPNVESSKRDKEVHAASVLKKRTWQKTTTTTQRRKLATSEQI